ncbi:MULTISPECIES: hypothetical protein [Chryseobacterium]|uniref:Uncharacterized protein n=1 Tax=Chryseobacterium camelliae TaxID=1265445 RepID=A0ABU0THV7_9FLAO|nr:MULTISPECIES: hypothetical protein [Chryseobacterium]MDT3409501.1 hypothetical protein [Pseudacidovorax intermedius]MDQ1096634.1 hypothetical protein [Chryseobacterium camelliae]MDQ1100576.1 hypothetical protein [Chryseobacterium sp. SORGH_AS_1048]MDR6087916.1 hypothetical protein [Chryseobacterium sp. SORGH_AS_0909]MDR6132290.1 hypothetical protein [Chryseobacterium sp. SORGH_AS_1175]
MKKSAFIIMILGICITCGNTVSRRNHEVQNTMVKKDTIVPLNDTVSLYYASYNSNMKLWYNLYIVKKNKRIKVGKGNEYKGSGSELFSRLSPNANYVVVDSVIKDYVHESDTDSTLHENYTCAIIDLKKAKIIRQMQQDCDGSWNKKNQWVSSGGKVVF